MKSLLLLLLLKLAGQHHGPEGRMFLLSCWCCCWCCGAAVVLLSCCSYQTASKARNNCCCCCAYKDTAPAGRGNTMALKDERGPKYTFSGAGTSLLKSPRKSLLLNSKACYCYCYYCYCYIYTITYNYVQLRSGETNTRPCRTGKQHGPEGRTGSKICVFRGRNVPSEIS